MKKLHPIFLLLLLLVFACEDREHFSSETHLKLSFSDNIVCFDTVFTTIGSATKDFRIYNTNNESLIINLIELVNAEMSGFRINIDGEKGTKLQNLPILGKDSLYGFIEVTVDPDSSTSLQVSDSIRFETNGNVQYVRLEAIGKDVHILRAHRINEDIVLPNDKPYLIYDSLIVDKDVNLSIKENTTFYFHNKAFFKIYGTLSAQGTIKHPISFRGDRLDKLSENIPYDHLSGQWGGIYFDVDSYNNALQNIFIRNSEIGIAFATSDINQKKATLENVIVRNTSKHGVTALNCNVDARNCLFANSGGATLALNGGKYNFLHCTVANYYRIGARKSPALILTDNEQENPVSVRFTNTIIYGTYSNELLLDESTDRLLDLKFTNCLIKNAELRDDRFVNTIWSKDPEFANIDHTTYSYDFHLTESSSAVNAADGSSSILAPYDLDGVSRLATGEGVDIGCYEWIQE